MSRPSKQIALLATIFMVVAAGLFLLPREKTTVPLEGQVRPPRSLNPFVTLRSSHHQSAEDVELRAWREALGAADRCAAFSKLVETTVAADRALQWAATIDDESSRDMAREAIACAFAKAQPEAAAQSALQVEDQTKKAARIMTVF